MGTVINFPTNRLNRFQGVKEQVEKLDHQQPLDTAIFSNGEDKAFMALIREWPCFQHLEPDVELQCIFEQYYDDELDEPQDCVLEFVFHMHDPDSVFDIGNALYTWDEDDRNFFFVALGMHADLIDQVKREEL